MDRVALLNEVLSQNPTDAFARYGLAMEYSKAGDVERALDEFGKLLATHPDYTAGYFMAAQTLAKAERVDEAKKMLADGIASAKKTGNGHAQAEMEAMLAELENSRGELRLVGAACQNKSFQGGEKGPPPHPPLAHSTTPSHGEELVDLDCRMHRPGHHHFRFCFT